MAERIQSLLFTEKELLANVAHELRTPLARIGVALDLAGEGDAEAARASLRRDRGRCPASSRRSSTTSSPRCASRSSAATGAKSAARPPRRSVAPSENRQRRRGSPARAAPVTRALAVTVGPELPPIHVDPMLLRRVIDNLIQNAHKYTPDHEKPIELDVTAADGGVTFQVRDHGIGISAEDLPRVFTPFFPRRSGSRSRRDRRCGPRALPWPSGSSRRTAARSRSRASTAKVRPCA